MYFSHYLIVFFAILSVYISGKVYKKFWNVCSLMNILWAFITVGASFSFFGLRRPGEQAIYMILCFLLSYSIVTCMGPFFLVCKKKALYFGEDVDINSRFTDILFIIMTISVIPGVIGQIRIFLHRGLKEMHESYLYGRYDSSLVGAYKYWCSYIILPFFLTICIYAIYDWIIRKKVSKLSLEAVIGICFYFLITGGRKIVLLCTIYFVTCIYMKKRVAQLGRVICIEKKKIPTIAFFICVTIGLISLLFYLTGQRLYGKASVMEMICLYMFGGLSLFDIMVHSPQLYGIGIEPLLHGKCLLGMITIPISTAWSFLTGADYQGADYLVNLYAEKFYRVSPRMEYNAAVTILYPMIRDYGWIGVAIGGALFGVIVVYVYNKAFVGKNKLFWQIVLIQVFYSILFSIWRYAFIENITVMSLIWSWILYKGSVLKFIRKQGCNK